MKKRLKLLVWTKCARRIICNLRYQRYIPCRSDTHLSDLKHLLVFLLQQPLQLVDGHLCVSQSPRSLVVLLCRPRRQTFALQHLQQLLY